MKNPASKLCLLGVNAFILIYLYLLVRQRIDVNQAANTQAAQIVSGSKIFPIGSLGKPLGSLVKLKGRFLPKGILNPTGHLFKVYYIDEVKTEGDVYINIEYTTLTRISEIIEIDMPAYLPGHAKEYVILGYECGGYYGVTQDALNYFKISQNNIELNLKRMEDYDIPDFGGSYEFRIIDFINESGP